MYAPVRPHHAEFGIPDVCPFESLPLECLHPLAVVWMDEAEPFLVGKLTRVGWQAVKARVFRRDRAGIRAQVPLPYAHMSGDLGQSETPLAIPQGALRLYPLGDVFHHGDKVLRPVVPITHE